MAAAVALCLPVLAQAGSDPADSRSPAPAPRYESAFTDYSPWKKVSAGDWRAANDAVGAGSTAPGRSGAGAPAAPSAPAATSTGAPAANPVPAASADHEGHHPQGGEK